MTTREENFMAMVKATIQVLEQHKSVWEGNKRFKKSVDDLHKILSEVEHHRQNGLTQSKGITSQKEITANKAAELAASIAKRVKVFARDEQNHELMQKVSFSTSDYKNMSDTVLPAQLQNLIGSVTPHIDHLEDYGVTQTKLDELTTLKDQFKALESQPRTMISERKMHNAAIPELIQELRSDLKSLDGLVGIFENAEFENQFKNARMIIDRGQSTAQKTPPTTKN